MRRFRFGSTTAPTENCTLDILPYRPIQCKTIGGSCRPYLVGKFRCMRNSASYRPVVTTDNVLNDNDTC